MKVPNFVSSYSCGTGGAPGAGAATSDFAVETKTGVAADAVSWTWTLPSAALPSAPCGTETVNSLLANPAGTVRVPDGSVPPNAAAARSPASLATTAHCSTVSFETGLVRNALKVTWVGPLSDSATSGRSAMTPSAAV